MLVGSLAVVEETPSAAAAASQSPKLVMAVEAAHSMLVTYSYNDDVAGGGNGGGGIGYETALQRHRVRTLQSGTRVARLLNWRESGEIEQPEGNCE